MLSASPNEPSCARDIFCLINHKAVLGSRNRRKIFYEVGDRLPFVGCSVGVIVADSAKRARAAAKKVVVSVSESVEEETLDDPLVDLAAAASISIRSPLLPDG